MTGREEVSETFSRPLSQKKQKDGNETEKIIFYSML